VSYRSTKRGRPIERVKRSRWNYGFHWHGRDDRGVSIWDGQPDALKWGARIMTATGGSLLLAGVIAFLLGGLIVPPAVLAGVGALHSTIAFFMNRQVKRIAELATLEQASKDFEIDQDRISQAIELKGIKPRMIMNGEPLFDPADLDQAATLLRAAPPPPDEELLRAAYAAPTVSETLLQPASEPIPHSTFRTPQSEDSITLKQGSDDA